MVPQYWNCPNPPRFGDNNHKDLGARMDAFLGLFTQSLEWQAEHEIMGKRVRQIFEKKIDNVGINLRMTLFARIPRSGIVIASGFIRSSSKWS
jgi:hypothetical protein